MQIVINNNAYKLRFGMACLRMLGKMWQINSLNEVLLRVSIIDRLENETDVDLQALEVFEDIVKAAIRSEVMNKVDETDLNYLSDWLLTNMDQVKAMFEELISSMPQQEQGKVQAPK